MPFTSRYVELSYTFMFCSKKTAWCWKRPQKGILQGLQLVRKVRSGLCLSSFSSCLVFHSSWFFHAVQVFGLWCLNQSIMLAFNERISPLEKDSPGIAFASYIMVLANKNCCFSFALWSQSEGDMLGEDFSSWVNHAKLLQVKQGAFWNASLLYCISSGSSSASPWSELLSVTMR